MNTMSKRLHHFSLVCLAVLKDFQIFGRFVRSDIALYTKATYEVGLELWREYAPEKVTFPKLPSLPSLPSLPELPQTKGLETLKKHTERDDALSIVTIFALLVFLSGCLWFFVIMLLVG